ncbi:DNA topoisomerase 1-like [Diachasma alloeum]|uniref:DNA topoisomerase 1-like n=1 Tax=Diachasma alloeum TaxID=454923 RepID=UPI00073822CD|nr:DNA topoisomerase 1-like [Diachasma alloeum]
MGEASDQKETSVGDLPVNVSSGSSTPLLLDTSQSTIVPDSTTDVSIEKPVVIDMPSDNINSVEEKVDNIPDSPEPAEEDVISIPDSPESPEPAEKCILNILDSPESPAPAEKSILNIPDSLESSEPAEKGILNIPDSPESPEPAEKGILNIPDSPKSPEEDILIIDESSESPKPAEDNFTVPETSVIISEKHQPMDVDSSEVLVSDTRSDESTSYSPARSSDDSNDDDDDDEQLRVFVPEEWRSQLSERVMKKKLRAVVNKHFKIGGTFLTLGGVRAKLIFCPHGNVFFKPMRAHKRPERLPTNFEIHPIL